MEDRTSLWYKLIVVILSYEYFEVLGKSFNGFPSNMAYSIAVTTIWDV